MDDWVPQCGYPLIFHGVKAPHQRLETSTGQSKSIFNPSEVEEVEWYVLKLKLHLDETQIGILSPYKLQVRFVRYEI